MKLSKYEIVCKIINECQYEKVLGIINGKHKKILLDIQSAKVVKKLFDDYLEIWKDGLEKFDWYKLVNMGWSYQRKLEADREKREAAA